ncbi:MAG: hypothetical protein ACMG6E_08105 [Candidatus Roizmanbacteria bacterium]
MSAKDQTLAEQLAKEREKELLHITEIVSQAHTAFLTTNSHNRALQVPLPRQETDQKK